MRMEKQKVIRFGYKGQPFPKFSLLNNKIKFEYNGQKWFSVLQCLFFNSPISSSIKNKFYDEILAIGEEYFNSLDENAKQRFRTIILTLLKDIVKTRFLQNIDLKETLLNTNNAFLFYKHKKFFWELEKDDKLAYGIMLMEIREEIRK